MADPNVNVNDTPTPTDLEQPATAPIPTSSTEPEKKLSRDEARAAIFQVKSKSELTTFNGVKVELREPSVQDVLDFQQNLDRKAGVSNLLVNYVYLPDGEKLFEPEDAEQLLALPWNQDFNALQNKILLMMGVVPTPEDKSPDKE